MAYLHRRQAYSLLWLVRSLLPSLTAATSSNNQVNWWYVPNNNKNTHFLFIFAHETPSFHRYSVIFYMHHQSTLVVSVLNTASGCDTVGPFLSLLPSLCVIRLESEGVCIAMKVWAPKGFPRDSCHDDDMSPAKKMTEQRRGKKETKAHASRGRFHLNVP